MSARLAACHPEQIARAAVRMGDHSDTQRNENLMESSTYVLQSVLDDCIFNDISGRRNIINNNITFNSYNYVDGGDSGPLGNDVLAVSESMAFEGSRQIRLVENTSVDSLTPPESPMSSESSESDSMYGRDLFPPNLDITAARSMTLSQNGHVRPSTTRTCTLPSESSNSSTGLCDRDVSNPDTVFADVTATQDYRYTTTLQNNKMMGHTLDEVDERRNDNIDNNSVYFHVSETKSFKVAKLDVLEGDLRKLREDILTRGGSTLALRRYLRKLHRISDLDPNVIPQYAQDDVQNFVPFLQSNVHDILRVTTRILEFYASHRAAWHPVSEKHVIAELVRLLSNKYRDVKLIAAKIISRLAAFGSVSAVASSLDVIQCLVPLLRVYQSPELQKAAAESLVHIVRDETSSFDALKYGAFQALIPLLKSKVTMRDAAMAMYNISLYTDAYPISFNSIRPLIDLLCHREINFWAMGVLCNITPHMNLSPGEVPLLQGLLTSFELLNEDSETWSTIIKILGNLGKSHMALEFILPYFVAILPKLSDPATQILFCDTLLDIIPAQDPEAIQIAESAQLYPAIRMTVNAQLSENLDNSNKSDLQKKTLLILGRLRPYQQGDHMVSSFSFRSIFRVF